MMIFQGVGHSADDQSTVDAVGALIRAMKKRGVRKPWSLAELNPDDDDLAWLGRWAADLTPDVAGRWLGSGDQVPGWLGISKQGGIGLLVLLLISEIVRRRGIEGEAWPFLLGRFRNETERLVLSPHPTRLLKDAIEDAVNSMSLRHVFGLEGVQDWLDTIYLQFGFTRRGFELRLPEWLLGVGHPQAVRRLLEGPLRSASFAELWNRLQDYRLFNDSGAIRETVLIAWMESNPWVLPSWLPTLPRKAMDRPQLRVETTEGAAIPDDVIGASDTRFLDDPILSWTPGISPVFLTRVIPDALGVSTSLDSLNIVVGGRVISRLVRQSNGTFAASPDEVRLQSTATVTARLESPDGGVLAIQDIELWDDAADLTVFRLANGHRMKDPWAEALRPKGEYALLIQSDLTLNPRPAMWHALDDDGTMVLFYVGPGAGCGLRLCLGDETLWDSASSGRARQRPEAWSENVTVAPSTREVTWGGAFNVKVSHPTDVVLLSTRFRGNAIPRTIRGNTSTEVGPIKVDVGIAPKAMTLDLFLGHGAETQRIRHDLKLDIVGAAQRTEDGWRPRAPTSVLTIREARSDSFRILPPRHWQGQEIRPFDWLLMEGEVWVSRVSRSSRPLGALLGLGSALSVRAGPTPYNVEGDALIVAASVLDPGILRGGGTDTLRRQVSLKLSESIDIDDEYTVVLLGDTGIPTICTADEIEPHGERSWIVPSTGDVVAFAPAYKGTRLGAWWSSEMVATLLRTIRPSQAGQVAAILRWLWTPVLAQRHLAATEEFARTFPGPTLAAWMQDQYLHPGLTFGSAEKDWLPAIRRVFWDWRPSPKQADDILDVLMARVEDRLDSIALLLSRVDPILMSRTLLPRLQGLTRDRGRAAAQELVEQVLGAVERSFVKPRPAPS